MRCVIQRVKSTSVEIEGKLYSKIGYGMLILVGIENSDTFEDAAWLSSKIVKLRIFNDDDGIMNRSVTEIGGEIMVVSQFTLHASTKKGNRPSYIRAANPEIAIPLYEEFIRKLEEENRRRIYTGKFGAHMEITLINDGPVTITIDTKNKE
jgi:D-tyrosyl-tRNA(Tyr) deacylase